MESSKLPLVNLLLEKLRRRSDHEAIKAAMSSKGDITRMEGYNNLRDCISCLLTLDRGMTLGKSLRVAKLTHESLLKNHRVFADAFGKGGSEAVQYVYANTVAALWHLVSLICAEGVTFVKTPSGSYGPIINKNGVDSLNASIFVTRLEQFNAQADKYGFKKIVTESAPIIEKESLREDIGFIPGILLAVTGLVALLLIARDLAEKFYSLRGTFSRWLDTQASFLEMNAATLVNKPVPREKQEAYAAKLRALSDRIRVDDADTENQAVKAIAQDNVELNKFDKSGVAPESYNSSVLL